MNNLTVLAEAALRIRFRHRLGLGLRLGLDWAWAGRVSVARQNKARAGVMGLRSCEALIQAWWVSSSCSPEDLAPGFVTACCSPSRLATAVAFQRGLAAARMPLIC
jgi:hypothetical protein